MSDEGLRDASWAQLHKLFLDRSLQGVEGYQDGVRILGLMSITVEALLEHSLTSGELDRLEGRLNSLRAELAGFLGGGDLPEWEWSLDQANPLPSEELAQFGIVAIYLPGHLDIRFSPGLLSIGHVAQWMRFLRDSEVQAAVGGVVELLARFFGSDRLVYLPDSQFSVTEVLSLELPSLALAESRLFELAGQPSLALLDIYQVAADGTWSGNGYFVQQL